jgi:pilus assembly protein CpaF
MPCLIVRDAQGNEKRLAFDGAQPITIGKKPTNALVLASQNYSREHCMVLGQGDKFYLRDLQSRNGTYLNGQRVPAGADVEVPDGGVIQVVDTQIVFVKDATATPPVAKSQAAAAGAAPSTPPGVAAVPDVPVSERRTPVELKKKIHEYLIATLDLKHADLTSKTPEEVRARATEAGFAGAASYRADIPAWLDPKDLVKEVVDEAVGLGPLEDLLADESVDEIMVNGWSRVYIERRGKIEMSPKQFTSNDQVMAVIWRILAPIGRRVDESSPMVNARLRDGSRVNAIIPPLALTGPTLTIRKFARNPFSIDDLVYRFDSLSPEMARFMALAVENRMNVCISGGTGSGKTTLLNVLSNFIPPDERIITIEDAAELKLHQEHVVSLEAKPANIEGKGAIPIRDLVVNALRMRPDRIVVGECRSGEALDMLQAMNTGHDGSLTTLHANSPRDALSRLETMVLMAGLDLPSRAIREQISSAINLIVHQSRMPDGTRKVTHISEITGIEVDVITMSDVYVYERRGFGPGGEVLGRYKATGYVPRFVQVLRQRGIPFPMELFREPVEEPDRPS